MNLSSEKIIVLDAEAFRQGRRKFMRGSVVEYGGRMDSIRWHIEEGYLPLFFTSDIKILKILFPNVF